MRGPLQITSFSVLLLAAQPLHAQEGLGEPRQVEIPRSDGSIMRAELILTSNAPHGVGPVVLVALGGVPSSAAAESNYLHHLADELRQALTKGRLSVLTLEPHPWTNDDTSADARLAALVADFASARTYLESAHGNMRRAGIVGFGEAAVAAARIASTDPRLALVALAPFIETSDGVRTADWTSVLGAARQRFRPVVVLHTPCYGEFPADLLGRADFAQQFIILPQYNAWLAPMHDGRCMPEDYQLVLGRYAAEFMAGMIADWIVNFAPFRI